MTPEDWKKLEEAHKKAMEGLSSLKKSLQEEVNATKDYLGMTKNI